MYQQVDVEGYRRKIEATKTRLIHVRKVLSRFQDSRFVADYIDELEQLTHVFRERFDEVVRLAELEKEASRALDNSSELYNSARKVFGALLYFEVPDETIQLFFPRGLPRATKVPVETLRVIGNRLCEEKDGMLGDYRDIHPLIDEVRFHLEDSRSTAAAEVTVGQDLAQAIGLLQQANANLDTAVSVMFHLVKADNVLFPGMYRAMYPVEGVPDELPVDLTLDSLDEPNDDMRLEGAEGDD